ncbi:MAG: hypothetical protein M3408_08175 [Actinomycetota bacterium]|nr:hypothetical protein [Actinomycetota bacterium]
MFTRSDLSTLLTADPALGISIFLPTHVLGSEVRQGPIRLKNLTAQARDDLVSTGLERAEAEAFLAPATALIEDYRFWQHQNHGLALFLDGGEPRCYRVPLPLAERVVVGPGFHVRPLLPVLEADGAFLVVTITADQVRLCEASRFALVEDDAADLPRSLDEVLGEADYQNPLQASPVARPNTGSISISQAQVYGDSPAEWRKGRLVEFARRVAAALQQHVAANPTPIVLVADAKIGGHIKQLGTLGPLLAGVVETNPEAMDDRELHDAAYAVMRPRLDAARTAAAERFATLRGNRDARAVTGIDDVMTAAHQGRIDTLLLVEDETVGGRVAEFTATADDVLEAVAVQTLQHGGAVHLLPEKELSHPPAAAILRY